MDYQVVKRTTRPALVARVKVLLADDWALGGFAVTRVPQRQTDTRKGGDQVTYYQAMSKAD